MGGLEWTRLFFVAWIGLETLANPHLSQSGKRTDIFTDTKDLGVLMRTIDIHAHITPAGFVEASKKGESWHGMPVDAMAIHRNNPKTTWTPEERLADMNSLGVDVQVLSTNAYFYNYEGDAATVKNMAAECNDYVSDLVKAKPDRFAGFATLPMQDIKGSIAELERGMKLGLKGACLLYTSPSPRD